VADRADYLELTVGQARQQFWVNHRHFGGSTAHRAPEPVPSLARLFSRPPSSVLAKMANLDGSRAHGGKWDVLAGAILRDKVADLDTPPELPALIEKPPNTLAQSAGSRQHLDEANTTAKVAGPSNIGNYLTGLGIPATAGFGVDYRGLHGTDERIRLDSVPQVQAVYHRALLTLLHAS
jgi:acetylornithine deacetylase/succinyl-diaminopimelate desuccinylase-like protein